MGSKLMDARLSGGVADDTDSLARAFASARIRLSALAADGQTAQMTNPAVALDPLQPLQIHADLATKVAFDHVFAILNGMDNLRELLLRQILRANGGINTRASQNVFGVAGADPVNVAQRDVDAFIGRNFYSDDASHVSTGLIDCWIEGQMGCLALPLFVSRVRANDADDTFATNDFAILAKLFD
jgi:hypothetical protein